MADRSKTDCKDIVVAPQNNNSLVKNDRKHYPCTLTRSIAGLISIFKRRVDNPIDCRVVEKRAAYTEDNFICKKDDIIIFDRGFLVLGKRYKQMVVIGVCKNFRAVRLRDGTCPHGYEINLEERDFYKIVGVVGRKYGYWKDQCDYY